MEPLSLAGEPFTGPWAIPALATSDPEQRHHEEYNTLLHKIAGSFGFSNAETEELVRATRAYACSHKTDQGSLPCRVWLAKVLVHQCVFRISSELFRQAGSAAEKKYAGLWNDDYLDSTIGVPYLQKMPLSFRVVYILSRLIGFTATEIAAIVNAPLFTVKERYYKAQAFLLAHR